MTDIEAHPTTTRLSAYAGGRLDASEMDEIEQHLSSCDSCCQWIRDQPADSLVEKLRGRGAATETQEASAVEPPSGFQVPSSFVLGPDATAALHGEPTVASLPRELNDHPRYRVVAALGTGGMGTVYRAEHRLMDRPVALKVIRREMLGNAALVERFRREVKSAARLASHPNIVAAYDAEQAGDTHMLIMEFIEGTDLARLVDRRGPLPVGEACEYARQAALGLQHAFEDGMVHRDIKPQNLMRTTRGQVKILDFGLARFASEVGSHAGVTAEGMVLGSADYIAPEQIEDPHAADVRADIYSLGCTLYFLLAGQSPFPDRSLIQKLIAHREKTARPLREIRADVPPELAQVIERMMAKDPARRFPTPEDVARALAPFADARAAATGLDAPTIAGARTRPATLPSFASMVGEQKPSEQATRSEPRPRRPWVWIAAALALLPIVAVSLALILYQLSSIPTPTGELVIESDDPDIEVIVKQGGQQVTIVAPKTRNRIELKAGQYELQLAGEGEGLKLSTDTFTLERGGKTVVTVRREPPVQAPQLKPPAVTQGEPRPAIAISPRTKAILAKLTEPIAMDFANETSLEDVLTYIKQATAMPFDPGIPIYVDPIGLLEARRTLLSTARMNVSGASLKATLPQLLGQLDLAYLVKDDVLIISSSKGIDRERNETASPAADASPGTKRVLAKLDESISMSFADAPSLENVLAYIKQATATPGFDGIPIHVDPLGLQEAKRSLNSTVSMDLDDVPLKTTLRLILKQLGLAYTVKDGLLIISSAEGIRKPKGRADETHP
jgi:serine/threonine protein kinase